MPQTDETKRYAAISRIENGEDKKVVADDLDVSYATVIRWYREFTSAKENGTLEQLFDLDSLLLATAGKLIEAGPLKDDVKKGIEAFKGKVATLQVLQEDMIVTAQAVNAQIKSRLLSVEHISELYELTECLCALQNAFFNKPVTQVNVQNNYESGSKYGGFLDDKPADN